MKCPFCGAELEKEQGSERWWYCVNAKCVHIASGESSEWEDSTITAMKAIKEITSITTQELDK